MNEETRRFLSHFDLPRPVEYGCREAFGQSRHFAVPAIVKDAVKDGLLEVQDLDGAVKDNAAIYGREMMLTDKARKLLGIEVTVVERKSTKKPQKELF